jgi:chromosome segregation ATPase
MNDQCMIYSADEASLITELRSQLAEKDKEIEELNGAFKVLFGVKRALKSILKEKIAEKDKEIEMLKSGLLKNPDDVHRMSDGLMKWGFGDSVLRTEIERLKQEEKIAKERLGPAGYKVIQRVAQLETNLKRIGGLKCGCDVPCNCHGWKMLVQAAREALAIDR